MTSGSGHLGSEQIECFGYIHVEGCCDQELEGSDEVFFGDESGKGCCGELPTVTPSERHEQIAQSSTDAGKDRIAHLFL